MKSWNFESAGGLTGRVTIEDESYVIINFNKDSSEAIEIDLKKILIKIYDDRDWTILPMDSEQQFNPKTRVISHITHL